MNIVFQQFMTMFISRTSFTLSTIYTLSFLVGMLASTAEAQVAISIGVQEVYDDNIFLENDNRQPTPFVSNSVVETDLEDGTLSSVISDENDGVPDEDLLTTITIGMSGEVPLLQQYLTSTHSNSVGFVLFSEAEEQNRLTLDSSLSISAKEALLARPFHFDFRSAIRSSSTNAGVAQGTASRAAQTLTLNLNTGVRNVSLTEALSYNLGYQGAYNAFLGEFNLNSDRDERFEARGADYHSHTAVTSLDFQATERLRLSLLGSAGVQLFTQLESDDLITDVQDEDDFDRTVADIRVNGKYKASERISLNAGAGIGFSSRHNDIEDIVRNVVDEDGNVQTVTIDQEEDQTALLFSGGVEYFYMPGSVIRLSASQQLASDLDGDQITTRNFSGNITHAINARVKLTAGSTFVQFANDDTLSNSQDRFEISTSVSYFVTENASLALGYNFAKQTTDASDAEEQLRLRSLEYEVNRAFLSLNYGFVGLPL